MVFRKGEPTLGRAQKFSARDDFPRRYHPNGSRGVKSKMQRIGENRSNFRSPDGIPYLWPRDFFSLRISLLQRGLRHQACGK
jgi:hypothetical protein